MNYLCSECHKPIGLMTDRNGTPCMYRCPHTGRLAEPQTPVKRDAMPVTPVGQFEVLRQLRIAHYSRKERQHDARPNHPID
jgi:hypothetical protein